MNRPIQRVSIAVIVIIVLLLGNATYVQVFRADALRNDPRNLRVLFDEYSRQRGMIVAADGTVLARSVPSGNRFKYQRQYPTNPNAFAPVTGFYSLRYGADRGLEAAEGPFLSGSDDRLFTQRFADMFSGRDPRGGNVVTTIDPRLQTTAFDALRSGQCDGVCRGAVVALEPATGKILAMVSTPSYDPNSLATQDFAAAERSWNELTDEDMPSRMTNRAIDELYPPGSTFKVVTTATGLAAGLSPNTRLTAAPTFPLPDSSASLPNNNGEACPGSTGGTVSLTQAFEYSCNTAFAQLVTEKLPGNPFDAFIGTAKKFGVGENPPGIPMHVASSTVGDLGDDKAALAQSSIGERSVRVTALQNAVIAATVANGGIRMRPYLVDKLQTADLRTVSTTTPSSVNRPISAEEADSIAEMMVKSEQQTYQSQSGIASKTGTTDPNRSGSAYAWYIAFAPSSNSRIAVAVVVENGNQGAESYGGVIAAPIGRAVLNAYTGGN
ncbi:penicillin-binding protein 2 [Gordonia alkaliphila]|uniref:penicillin-binding transpeptidase domain-containing protein n=1 Tax=Gordonia alkaliphila TaxID=1053547 RepID=UPI001FF4F15D|nr:penicillin-binding transpeptidase domain-containing protein [Gordonia alkaliphila]MCK0439045.1 penicillin-binding protein 2 [Gordonia alkaliphila]